MVMPPRGNGGPPLSGWVARVTVLAALAMPGCAYVGPSAIEDKVDSLDHDGDGAPYGGPNRDCNDFNPHETPGKPEIPYDGWDNDCSGADLLDIDGDGFPGVSKEWYLANNPEAEWPAGMPNIVDCVDDPEIHPRARDIYPGAPDIPYDGIDSDCAGDTDFDVDGDGYMPDTFVFEGQTYNTAEAYEAYVAEWNYDHLGPGTYGDCNDFDAAVHPGVDPADDIWYDGVDSDCAGNNDFDQDGDGFMPDWDQLPIEDRHANSATAYATLYNGYIEQYHNGEAPWGEPSWGDCLDRVDPLFAVDPADVYPGAPDQPYDGIDSDCAKDNDFDQDLDGFMPDAFGPSLDQPTEEAFDTYVANWGYTHLVGSAVYGDCDDTDAAVRPGALERFGHPTDFDCDGDPDTTPWGFDGYHWGEPLRPKVLGTETHYLVIAAAPTADFNQGTLLTNVGAAMIFPRPNEDLGIPGVGNQAVPGQRVLWQPTSANPIHGGLDAASTGVDVYAGFTFTLSSSSVISQHLLLYNPTTDLFTAPAANRDYAGTTTPYFATDYDVLVDAEGEAWSVSCDPTSLHVIRGGRGPGTGTIQGSLGSRPFGCELNDPPNCTVYGPRGGICFFDGPPDLSEDESILVNVCEPEVGCETFKYRPDDGLVQPEHRITVHDEQPWAGVALTAADYRDGWHLLTHPTAGATVQEVGGTTAFDLLTDYTLRSFDAVRLTETEWFFVALTDVEVEEDEELVQQPTILLAWGDPSVTDAQGVAELNTMYYPFSDPDRPGLALTGVSIHADADRLALAISAEDPDAEGNDAIGWVFLGWP